ncbi:signal peptide peptidase-domain-containing protein [Lactifluus volemus]|nr:signal peptide peptidase-domain-containing protein [Lactifluus volemus]
MTQYSMVIPIQISYALCSSRSPDRLNARYERLTIPLTHTPVKATASTEMFDGFNVDLQSACIGIVATAIISVYAGSFGSLSESKDPTKTSDDDQDFFAPAPPMDAQDVWVFSVLASIMLVSLFYIIKYVGMERINWYLTLHAAAIGLYTVPRSLIRLTRFAYGLQRWNEFERYRIRFEKASKGVPSFSFRTPSLFLVPLGFIPSLLYLYCDRPKPILLTNILALSWVSHSISVFKIDSFRTGCLFLSLLFLYDVWWVFGTNVMVTVAANLDDLPMTIIWPNPDPTSSSTTNGSMMLGLGDIFVPGLFISLALRYDRFRHKKTQAVAGPFPTPYFTASLVAYVAGLVCAIAVAHVSCAAQPALLYLSPACILSFVLTAWRRGELIESWKWNDDGGTRTPESILDQLIRDLDKKSK